MKQYEVIFADLDGTLINTISGETFPKGIWDMKLNFDALDAIKKVNPKCLLIITNQGGIEKGFVNRRNFKSKMKYLCRSIKEYTGIEVEYAYCTSNDKDNVYRKPNIGMIDSLMLKMINRGIIENGICTDNILMIGDASGKEGQFSDSDKRCAENAGFDYMDIADFVASLKIKEEKDVKLWIARDDRDYLGLYLKKPIWKTQGFSQLTDWFDGGGFLGYLDKNKFLEVTFENSPQQVELVIKKQDENRH